MSKLPVVPQDPAMMLRQEAGRSDITVALVLKPSKETKLGILAHDGQPAVGIVDLVHQAPGKAGAGPLLITWSEALEWAKDPDAPTESWHKLVTIVNHANSAQAVTLRFFFLR